MAALPCHRLSWQSRDGMSLPSRTQAAQMRRRAKPSARTHILGTLSRPCSLSCHCSLLCVPATKQLLALQLQTSCLHTGRGGRTRAVDSRDEVQAPEGKGDAFPLRAQSPAIPSCLVCVHYDRWKPTRPPTRPGVSSGRPSMGVRNGCLAWLARGGSWGPILCLAVHRQKSRAARRLAPSI